jgi:hypothetical protein
VHRSIDSDSELRTQVFNIISEIGKGERLFVPATSCADSRRVINRQIAHGEDLTSLKGIFVGCGRITAYPAVTGWAIIDLLLAAMILRSPSDRNTKLNTQYAHINATPSSCAG